MDEQNKSTEDKIVQVGKYKVKVIRNLCIGDGSCAAIAPNTFELDAEYKSVVKEGSTDSFETVMQAAQSCPAQIIVIFDETGKQVWPTG